MSENNDDLKFQVGLDMENPSHPVYFSFGDDDGILEFWLSYEEAKEMADVLHMILADIKAGVAYDSHH